MTDAFARTVLLLHFAATTLMLGVIWFVQVVHYPLFGRVGAEGFTAYEAAHQRLTTWIVAPPMLLELGTGLLLLWRPPLQIERVWFWVGMALIVVIWLSTALLQVPRHELLSHGFDPAAHRALVTSNWIRTVAWTARGGLLFWIVGRLLR